MTTTSKPIYAEGIEILGPINSEFATILTPEAMNFVAKLERTFRVRREELLQRRIRRQARSAAVRCPISYRKLRISGRVIGRLPLLPRTCKIGASKLPALPSAK